MKKIHRFIRFAVIAVMFGTMLGVFGATSNYEVEKISALSCIERPSTDSQATAQQECVERFVRDCRDKGFSRNFCQNLTVRQINRCAEDGSNYNLRRDCLNEIRQNSNDTPEEPTTFEGDCNEAEVKDLDSGNCAVVGVIKTITNTLAAFAGIIIVAMIIWGGIQYSTAGPDAAKVQAAKQKIANALIALMLLIFGFSLIQWLVPGGLL